MKPENEAYQPSPAEDHVNDDEIARRAYELYEARGREPGHEIDDWLDAEQQINKHGQVLHSEG